ncbi:MAG: hypothetical protein AAGN64_13610 [Bacteroidota bacterium]
MSNSDAPRIRRGSVLTYQELRAVVAAAVEDDGRTYAELAKTLGRKNATSVSNAVNNAGGRYLRVQLELLQLLKGYDAEQVIRIT